MLIDRDVVTRQTVDMRQSYDNNLATLASLDLKSGQTVTVRLITEGAGGYVHADLAVLEPIDQGN